MDRTGAAVRIGMPAQMDPGSDKQYLSRKYSDAVAAAGGMPLTIPLLEAPRSMLSVVASLNGLLLTGSNSDLDPALYGEARSEGCGPTQPLRDQMDFFLLETAFRRKIPVLAICYGIQSLNVFLGGSLIQDIPMAIETPLCHNTTQTGGNSGHEIQISAGSILEPIAGGNKARVNSTHHQAVKRTGRGLTVIARASDGIIESVAQTDAEPWILGVQWHPEKDFERDVFSRKLFEHFLARCRAVREG